VALIVARATPDDPAAAEEGRAFVGKRRARPGDPVGTGDVITIHPARAAAGDVTILANRGGIVAADKPAALPTIADHHGTADTLVARVAAALGLPAEALHATSRLDVGVSGVVLFATDRRAREHLAAARERGDYARRYLAIATKAPSAVEGVWDVPIGRARDARLRAPNGRDATTARSRYRVVATAPGGACLLALAPETGRTHQLRVHAAHVGAPLLGDGAYGGPRRFVTTTGAVRPLERIALHARTVSVPDLDGQPFVATSPIPDELTRLWAALDGPAGSWDAATWP
jgi:23S rRNA-/tRNA-specific pseudouridylate synthase